MLDNLFRIKKFIPSLCYHTVFDIDFKKLYENGKRYIIFDLDNTLIPYDLDLPDDKLNNLFDSLREMGFKMMIVSNNHNERISRFANACGMECVTYAKKPLKCGFKKAMKIFNTKNKDEIITIGDQLMTDILGSNRMKLDAILVHPLKKSSEKWYTKFNRVSERNALKRIKKHYPEIYKVIEEHHEY